MLLIIWARIHKRHRILQRHIWGILLCMVNIQSMELPDELYVKDNDRITVEFKADEDYFLKDVIYNGKSMLGSLKETYASDGSSQGSVSFNINNTSAVQTLEVQFSPEWAYSTALSGGNIVLSRYVGRNTVVNVPFLSEMVENPFQISYNSIGARKRIQFRG